MRTKTLFIQVLIVLFLLCMGKSTDLNAQDSAKNKKASKEALVKKLVDSQRFDFVPGFVSPMRGGRRPLTGSYYYLEIKKDSLICYLPYFGRAYTPPLSSTDISFDFTSTHFEYSVTMNKKGGWDITIKTKDQADVQQFFLTVFSNSSASLNVNSGNRDPISFEGNISKPPEKK